MGLERRGNNYYYYEKERNGDKVRSRNSGKGEIASILNQMRLWKKDEEDHERQRKGREKAREMQTEAEIESAVESVCEISELLTNAFFLTNGFHQHKRQWRKKRTDKV
jgi:hypothetical protein